MARLERSRATRRRLMPRFVRSRGSRPTSKRRAARCSRRSIGDGAAPLARACRDGARARCRDAVEAAGGSGRRQDAVRSRRRRSRRLRRPAAPRADGAGGDAHCARGPRIGAGQRTNRARLAVAFDPGTRAGAGWPRSAVEVAGGARSRTRRVRRRGARRARTGQWQSRSAGRGRRLSRSERRLRACRRSLPRRSAPARRRRDRGTGRRRPSAAA